MPRTLLLTLAVLCGLWGTRSPAAPPVLWYVIPEDNFVAEFLDSLVAPEEVVDTGGPPPAGVFTLDDRDLGLSYFQNVGDFLRFLPGLQANRFGPFGNRESVRLFGANPAQTALLINGLPAGCADVLGTNALALPAQNILRIEAAPLAGLLPDGVPASCGAVNLVTRGFTYQLPFYQFSSLTEETFQEQVGHLHFAQRIYRNLNFYMSSLLKKNTDDDVSYSAVQFNVKLDAYLRNGWDASVYSFSHTDERKKTVPVVLPPPALAGNSGLPPANKRKMFSVTIAGRPWQPNRTSLAWYRSTNHRTFAGDFQWAEWSDWGFTLRQELGNLVENQGLTAGLAYRSGAYITPDTTNVAGVPDTASHESRASEFSLFLKDTTMIMDLFDFTVSLNLSKFSCADNLQLLPASGLYYRRLPRTTLYLLAERTFRPLTAQEGARRQLPPGTVFYAYLPDTLAAVRRSPVPEKGSAVSLGATYQWAPYLNADAGFFYRELADAIYWDWPDSIFNANVKVFLNNRTEIYRGLFALAKFRMFRDHLNGCLSYTRLLNNDLASNGMVPALPDDRLAGFVQGKITIKKEQLMDVGLVVAGEYTGEQKKRAWDTDAGPLAAQTVLDVTLFYNYLYIKTYLTFKNILNREVETQTQKDLRAFFGYPPPPFNYQFGVSLELGGIYDRNPEQE